MLVHNNLRSEPTIQDLIYMPEYHQRPKHTGKPTDFLPQSSAIDPISPRPQNLSIPLPDLNQESLPRQEDILTASERIAFKPIVDHAITKRSRIASTLTLPITAALYFKMTGNQGDGLEISQMAITIASTAVLWYGSYFAMVESWKKKQISENPKLKEYFPKGSIQAKLKIFLMAEASWFASRLIGDTACVTLLGKLMESGQSANSLGGLASHLILSFWLYPKYIMPLLHQLFDQKKSKEV
ncbi:MAG: hypothetical protein WD512_06015 [Candidatus Paceibacterota bacterium]